MQNNRNLLSLAVGLSLIAIVLIVWWLMPAGNRSIITTPELLWGNSSTSIALESPNLPFGIGGGSIHATDVASVASRVPGSSRFNALFKSTGVSTSLKGAGPYTVFVPTDEALALMSTAGELNLSSAELKRLIQYHVVAGKKLDVDAVHSGQIQALSKDTLNFQVDTAKSAVYINSAYVLETYQAKNGIVYLISSALVPPARK